jgi:hypothetical protein
VGTGKIAPPSVIPGYLRMVGTTRDVRIGVQSQPCDHAVAVFVVVPGGWCSLVVGVPSWLVSLVVFPRGGPSWLVFPRDVPSWLVFSRGVPSWLVFPRGWYSRVVGVPSGFQYPAMHVIRNVLCSVIYRVSRLFYHFSRHCNGRLSAQKLRMQCNTLVLSQRPRCEM